MKTFLKIFTILFGALVLLSLVAVLALVLFVHPNDYKPQLQQLAAQQNVVLNIEGDLTWSFYPHIGIQVGKFSIKPAMKNVTKPFQFDGLTISVELLPLLHREIVVEQIVLRAAEITLQDDSSNNNNNNSAKANVTTIKNLVLESKNINLDQRTFPLSLSMQISTTQPLRDVQFKATTLLSVDHELQHVMANNLSLRIDDTVLTGTIDATLGSKPFIKVNLAGTALDLDRYVASAADTKNPGDNANRHDADNSHHGSPDDAALIPVSSIQALPGDYQLSFEDVTLQHLHANHFSVHVQISPEGMLTIQELKTNVYGGEFVLHGSVDTKPALPEVSIKTGLHNLDLEPALKDYLQMDKTFATGDFSFDASVNTRGLAKDALLQAMQGDFSFASKKITLNHLDITSSLNTSILQLLQVKLPSFLSGENQTVFSNMSGKGNIAEGVINNSSFMALGPCMQFNGAGTYHLLNANLVYQMGIVFPSSDTAKECQDINKKLKDISWPVVCNGSLDDGAAKICAADNKSIQKIVEKAAGKDLEKTLNDKLQKKFGKDADAIKNKWKGLF